MRTFKHYKGGEYFIMCHATVEATGEKVVVYQAVQGLRVWTRPVSEFYGEVEVDGQRVRRFQEVSGPDCQTFIPPISCNATTPPMRSQAPSFGHS